MRHPVWTASYDERCMLNANKVVALALTRPSGVCPHKAGRFSFSPLRGTGRMRAFGVWLPAVLGICFVLMVCTASAHADFYPGVGSDVSFTNQDETYYTLYGKLGYAPSSRTYLSAGYSHEWGVPQTSSTGTEQYHIIYADLYQRVGRKWKIGGIANYTFGATSDTDGYYSVSGRLEGRYDLTSIFSIGAGPVYYYVEGPGSFLGGFLGLYLYPVSDWGLYARGTADTSVSSAISQQDAELALGTSYTFLNHFSVYALYRLSAGITTNPVNNLSGASSGRGTMGPLAMGMGGNTGSTMNRSTSLNYVTSSISTVTLGLAVTF